ncbi:ribonuclease HI [Novacetimonas maltaceti]|uniref:Ribonuclease H n=1 Tax=Novacetimonas maltaceti TaxID=1203393 RepID=A0A2S3W4J6_9PROT|nr:ribonuclease HI [Novacetimonas maltaceti]POF63747.1 Ribonuclease HI [Novacetimonas maltaceti]PYD61900.1 ribonuclease HI [Novacetimonas maltaceti]
MDAVTGDVDVPGDDVVRIWTDGGCKPNPGPGGWAALLQFRGQEREITGGEAETTNNRMELTAVAEALASLKRPCKVILHSDSQYVCNGMTRWSTGWVRRKWRNASGDPVANMDLWQRLLDLATRHDITWQWVRGHAGDENNERVDVLATQARDALGIAYPSRRK